MPRVMEELDVPTPVLSQHTRNPRVGYGGSPSSYIRTWAPVLPFACSPPQSLPAGCQQPWAPHTAQAAPRPFPHAKEPRHMPEVFCKRHSYPPNAYLMEVFSEKHYKNFQIETISIHGNLHLLFPISKAARSALILTPACSSKPSAGELATQLPLETTGAIKFNGEKITP